MKLLKFYYVHAVVILSVLILWAVLSTSNLSNEGELQFLKSTPENRAGIIEPDSSVNYKIQSIEIDSTIEYELYVIDPEDVLVE